MVERTHLEWFRERLAASRAVEPKDPIPVLAWRETRLGSIQFKSQLIGLDQLRGWYCDEHGNVRHNNRQFFSIEGARVEGGDVREVRSWDQPIMTQSDAGFLGMLARETPGKGIEFLLQAIADCGNINVLQLGPSVQRTCSNADTHYAGVPWVMSAFTAESGVRIIYKASHVEEGSRFWKRSNQNMVAFLDNEQGTGTDMKTFYWASLSQIKELALMDNVMTPFVKTVLMPL